MIEFNSSDFVTFKYIFDYKTAFRIIIIIVIIIKYFSYYKNINIYRNYLNELYSNFQSEININFNNKINKKIRIAIYTIGLKDGGLQRFTSNFINYLNQIKLFEFYLFNQKEKEENEYKIADSIKRVIIKNGSDINYLLKQIKKYKIDILIYQFPIKKEIQVLNNLNLYNLHDVKVIFYIHSSFFYWFYSTYYSTLDIYKQYIKSKYVITQIPLENDYLFKKWRINSVLFNNFLTYDYNLIIPSNLSDKNILLIGRGRSILKRFNLGIQAIEYIKQDISDIKLFIISSNNCTDFLKHYVDNLNLEFNIYFANMLPTLLYILKQLD